MEGQACSLTVFLLMTVLHHLSVYACVHVCVCVWYVCVNCTSNMLFTTFKLQFPWHGEEMEENYKGILEFWIFYMNIYNNKLKIRIRNNITTPNIS